MPSTNRRLETPDQCSSTLVYRQWNVTSLINCRRAVFSELVQGIWILWVLTGKAGEVVKALGDRKVACVQETRRMGLGCRFFFGAMGKGISCFVVDVICSWEMGTGRSVYPNCFDTAGGWQKGHLACKNPTQQSAKVLLWETHEGTSLEYLWKLMS